MREQTCCFTGHRNIPSKDIPIIMRRTEEQIRSLIKENGVKYFGVGGALGYDTLAAQLLMNLRDKDKLDIKIILVAPFPDFTSKWTPDQQDTFKLMLPKYNKRVYTDTVGSREAYLKRDRHLVDCSRYCISYCTRNYGGTAYTVNYARKQGVQVFNTAM